MCEDEKSDIDFLDSQLGELQKQYSTLDQMSGHDFNLPNGQLITSDDNERLTRLADRYGLDGSIFRNLIPPSFDARPDVRAMLRLARKQMEMIARVIAAIEQQAATAVPADAVKYSASKSPTEWGKV